MYKTVIVTSWSLIRMLHIPSSTSLPLEASRQNTQRKHSKLNNPPRILRQSSLSTCTINTTKPNHQPTNNNVNPPTPTPNPARAPNPPPHNPTLPSSPPLATPLPHRLDAQWRVREARLHTYEIRPVFWSYPDICARRADVRLKMRQVNEANDGEDLCSTELDVTIVRSWREWVWGQTSA
jgi:hypothetical protein